MEVSCLEIEEFVNLTQDRSTPMTRPGDEPVAPAHDRRHDGPHFRGPRRSPIISGTSELRRFSGARPILRSGEDVRRYLQHLASRGVSAATVNGAGSALRFFFDITLDRPDIVRHLPVAREPRKAPVILSPEEFARML